MLFQADSVKVVTEARDAMGKTCIPVVELIEGIEIKFKLQSTAEILLAKAGGIQCETQRGLRKKNWIMEKCKETLDQKVT